MSVTTPSGVSLEGDLKEVDNYDSCMFGYLELEDGKKELIAKVISKYEDLIASDTATDPSLYSRLGHLHLLLEDFNKALSAYNSFFHLERDFWKNSSFLFGFGIVCFHFSAYTWSIKLFQQLLYNDPGFNRSNEVHFRLGLIFKITNNHQSAIKHFNQFLTDHRSSCASQSEARFHLGHLFEIQKKPVEACKEYERVIELPDTQVKKSVLADTYRQLGWLHHISEELGESTQRNNTALRYLQRSIEIDPNNGQTWYFLGRYYSSMGKVHDAFVSYRQSIDKSEASADTWCSIGVLYQEQNQPMDALQAYICAVQLDRNHAAAWRDLAVLYEACQQPKDALVCYFNCQHCLRMKQDQRECDETLLQRIKLLQDHVTTYGAETSNKGRILPCLEDAWTLPIPAELTQRQSAFKCPPPSQPLKLPSSSLPSTTQEKVNPSTDTTSLASLPGTSPSLVNGVEDSTNIPTKRQKLDPITVPKPRLAPFWYLTTQQLKVLNNLKLNRSILTSSQKMELERLEHSHAMMVKHQKAIKEAEERADKLLPSNVNQNKRELVHPNTVVSSSSTINGVNTSPVWTTTPLSNASVTSASNHCNSAPPITTDAPPVSTHLNNGDVLTKTLSEKFLKELPRGQLINCDGALSPALSTSSVTFSPERNKLPNGPVHSSPSEHPVATPCNDVVHDASRTVDKCNCVMETSRVTFSHESLTSSNVILTQSKLTNHVHGEQNGSVTSTQPPSTAPSGGVQTSWTKKENSSFSPSSTPQSPEKKGVSLSAIPGRELPPLLMYPGIPEDLPARDVITMCRKLTCNGVPSKHLFLDNCPPPSRPMRQRAVIPKDELCPSAPTIYLENKKEAMSRALADFCTNPNNPVTVIRGLASALKLDLGLFSTKTLVESNPEWEVEVRTQLQQPSEENWDSTFSNKVWLCESSRSYTSIAKYAQYQATTFREALQDEELKRNPSGSSNSSKKAEVDTDKSSALKKNFKTIKFGTNIDLSNEKKWRPQLQELSKLPWLFRLVSAGNMLSHVGHNILGMNTVQLYMKVPGSRTPGHQENNNYCAININIGPGDCEWFAVPEEYWGEIDELSEKNNINYLSGSWWPVLEDLYQANIPVYRFIQKPGDLVWLNAGTVHWVQAVGWCNNIAWNVGPVSAYQYQMSIERYEWNKMAGYKSIVPLLQLTWNMAQHVRVAEKQLFTMMKTCMMRTMWQCQQVLDDLKKRNIDVIWHGRNENEPTHYCESCDVEVFNLLFVRRSDNLQTHLVHCLNCARNLSADLDNFVVLNQYHTDELMRIYDQFTLAKKTKT